MSFRLIWIGIGLVAAGTYGIVHGFQLRDLAQRSEEWPTARGRIVSSQVTSLTVSDRQGGKDTYHYPKVVYEFEVDGRIRQGSRVSYAVYKFRQREPAEAIVSAYPAGKTVDVYFAPENPDDAVLERVTPNKIKKPALGVMILVVGVVILATGVLLRLGKQRKARLDSPSDGKYPTPGG